MNQAVTKRSSGRLSWKGRGLRVQGLFLTSVLGPCFLLFLNLFFEIATLKLVFDSMALVT